MVLCQTSGVAPRRAAHSSSLLSSSLPPFLHPGGDNTLTMLSLRTVAARAVVLYMLDDRMLGDVTEERKDEQTWREEEQKDRTGRR